MSEFSFYFSSVEHYVNNMFDYINAYGYSRYMMIMIVLVYLKRRGICAEMDVSLITRALLFMKNKTNINSTKEGITSCIQLGTAYMFFSFSFLL